MRAKERNEGGGGGGGEGRFNFLFHFFLLPLLDWKHLLRRLVANLQNILLII